MAEIILFIAIYCITYRFTRGTDETEAWGFPKWATFMLGKYPWAVYMGISSYLLIAPDIYLAAIVAVGSGLGIAFGWGKYFQMWGKVIPHLGGRTDYPMWSKREKEFWMSDRAGDLIYKITNGGAGAANMVAMGVRYYVGFFPMFTALAYATGGTLLHYLLPLSLLGIGLPFFLMRYVWYGRENTLAELLAGLWISVLIVVTINC